MSIKNSDREEISDELRIMLLNSLNINDPLQNMHLLFNPR